MCPTDDNESIAEIRAGDVTITDEGGVHIVNVQLAEAVKAAIRLRREEEAAKESPTNGFLCNIFRCGKAAETKGQETK